jgi:hypothetical protein
MGRERLSYVRVQGSTEWFEHELLRLLEKAALEVVVMQRYLALGKSAQELEAKELERLQTASSRMSDIGQKMVDISDKLVAAVAADA